MAYEFRDDKRFHYALAATLTELRSRRGITQGTVAAELGIDQAAVSRVESGARRLTVGEAFAWLEALGLNSKESANKLSEIWAVYGSRPPGFWSAED